VIIGSAHIRPDMATFCAEPVIMAEPLGWADP